MSKIIVGKPGNSGKAFRLAAILLSSTAVIGLTLTGAANAENWTGTASTDWFTAGNWDTNAVPTSADLATIDTIATNPAVIDGNDAVAGDVTVGQAGTGTLTVQNAGTLTTSIATGVIVGANAGSTGSITVTDAGSSITTDQFLVGQSGTGSLLIENQGAVTADLLAVGELSGASGNVTVDGANSVLTVNTKTTIGGSDFMGVSGGTGTLTISGGATVNSNTLAVVGGGPGANGFVTVDGAGSVWNLDTALSVGEIGGNGSVSLTNGGVVNAVNVTLGSDANSVGTITVDGAGSDLNATNSIIVGNNSVGNLTVQNSGSLETNVLVLGEETGSSGNITITGAGSTITLTNGVTIGNNGTGSFSLLAGASGNIDNLSIGENTGSGTALVDGTGTLLSITSQLAIGGEDNTGGGGTLTVSGGAEVESGQTLISNAVGSTGKIIVTGANSLFVGNDALEVGVSGNGTLNVLAGASAFALDRTLIGEAPGATGTVLVDGPGSSLNATLAVFVGGDGADPTGGNGTVTISNGGSMISQAAFHVGAATGGSSTVTVTDTNSILTVDHEFDIGDAGVGKLNIQNDGAVDAFADVNVGNLAGSNGTIVVNGTGSAFFTSSVLYLGNAGVGTLTASNGGVVDASDFYVGFQAAGQGNATIEGAGSQLSVTVFTVVGASGNGTLTMQDGASLVSGQLEVAGNAGSVGNLTISGTNATAVVGSDATIGDLGTASLSILGGGSLTDFSAELGNSVGSTGTALVDGANSVWTTNSTLDVGFRGNGTLTVSGGGALDAGATVVGGLAGSVGNVTVTGAQSTWNGGGIVVGYQGVGTALAENGATVLASNTIIGYQPGGTVNGTITVDGAGTTWTGSLATYVGFAGTGALNVTGGGVVTDQTGYIGDQQGSVGTAIVDGTGSQWNTLGTLTVGGDSTATGAGDGTLTVRNGGAVSAQLLNISDYAGATGNVTVSDAGSKLTSNLAIIVGNAATGALSVLDGGVATATTNFDMGFGTGSVGTATVDGTGSAITAAGFTIVGKSGTGTLHIRNGGAVDDASGFLAGAAGSSGTVTVDGAGSQWKNTSNLFVGSDGTGSLTISGGATVTAGTETFIGHDAGSNGTINIGAANGSAAAAPGTLDTPSLAFGQGTGTLNFNHTSTNYTFAAAISGAGTLNQIAGSTFLTANSNGFTGPTNILGGALHVNGAIKNSVVTVHTGGTLNGNGTVGAVTVQSGGVIAPGNSVGTLTVNGNYSAASGSIYQVQYGSAGVDRLNVSGKATIASGAILDFVPLDGGFAIGNYTLLSATGGLTGTFTVEGVPPSTLFHSATISYDADDVLLSVKKTNSFASIGITRNEIATGGAADTLPVTNAVSMALGNLQTVAAANDAFDQLSGEVHASIKTAALEDSRFVRDAALNHSRFDGTDASALISSATFWTEGFGAWGSVSNDGNAAALHRSTGGIFAGVNLPVPSYLRLGVLGGYSRTTENVKDRFSSASSDDYHVAIYGGVQSGDLDASIGGAYTWHDIATQRTVTFSGYHDHLSSAYDGGTAQVFGEIGYHLTLEDVAVEPIADLAYVNLATAGFNEAGGLAALDGRSDTTDATFSTLGARATTSFDVGGGSALMAHGLLGWRHAFGSSVPLTTMAFAGSQDFTIAGVPLARDSLTADLGVDATVADGLTLGVSYTGQLANDSRSNGVTANISWRF